MYQKIKAKFKANPTIFYARIKEEQNHGKH